MLMFLPMRARIDELLQSAAAVLSAVSQSPELDAEVLLAHQLGTTRTYLLAHPEQSVGRSDIHAFERLLGQRLDGQPIAYLTGQQEFYRLPLLVTSAVLVPRPATELLVDHLLERLGDQPGDPIVDVGTGSGAIALALAQHQPHRPTIGIDTSLPALRVAAANARRLQLAGRVDWRHGSLLEPVETTPIDVIVANLPYLTPAQMQEPSLAAEPAQALIGGHDGQQLYQALFNQAASRDDWRGLVIEVDPSQAEAIEQQLRDRWPAAEIVPISDGESIRGFGLWR